MSSPNWWRYRPSAENIVDHFICNLSAHYPMATLVMKMHDDATVIDITEILQKTHLIQETTTWKLRSMCIEKPTLFQLPMTHDALKRRRRTYALAIEKLIALDDVVQEIRPVYVP